MTWTRGKWYVVRNACVLADVPGVPDSIGVADCRTVDVDAETAAANAQLIAAAPEMFDELRAARDLLAASSETRVWPVLDRIRALIDRVDPLH